MSENLLVVNAEGPEIRVGVVQDDTLFEYFLEPKANRTIVGNIYRGRISRVLPGMQAAFVDLGPSVDKAAFLYVADILGSDDAKRLFADTDDGDEAPEATATRLARSRRQAATRKIEDLVKPNQLILVQIVKDPIGAKGARVTGYLSLPGRYSVFMPSVDHIGVSRRVASDKERRRLRELVNAVRPAGAGFIVRTAADGADAQEVRDDVDYLTRLWKEIGRREKAMSGPGLVYADLDLVLRTIRDLLRADTKAIIIDDAEQYERARKFTSVFLPGAVERIRPYEGRQPIFDHYGIEAELRSALGRRVPLKSGGSLVIDQGEALTAIDINTGSFVGKSDLEETVTKNNLEACREVARQLRLRNIGGIIVIDFVDMDKESNRKKVWDEFHKAMSADRSRCNITRISELGLVEMTRKRTRESLNQLLTEPCPECEGGGVIKSVTTVANEVLREIRRLGNAADADVITVECAPRVADTLRKLDREYIDELEKKFQKKVDITGTRGFKLTQYKVAGLGSSDGGGGRRARSGGSGRGRQDGGDDAAGGNGANQSSAGADGTTSARTEESSDKAAASSGDRKAADKPKSKARSRSRTRTRPSKAASSRSTKAGPADAGES